MLIHIKVIQPPLQIFNAVAKENLVLLQHQDLVSEKVVINVLIPG